MNLPGNDWAEVVLDEEEAPEEDEDGGDEAVGAMVGAAGADGTAMAKGGECAMVDGAGGHGHGDGHGRETAESPTTLTLSSSMTRRS